MITVRPKNNRQLIPTHVEIIIINDNSKLYYDNFEYHKKNTMITS